MFYCERCASTFNSTVAAAAGGCPRCKQTDGVSSPLRFRLFARSALKGAGPSRADASISQGRR